LLQQYGDDGVRNDGDLLRLLSSFNSCSVARAMQLLPGQDRVVWPKTAEHIKRRLSRYAGLNRRVEVGSARRELTQRLTGQPQPPAAPIEPLRPPPPPPAAPSRNAFVFPPPPPAAMQRTASKGGAGKARYSGCCGEASDGSANARACGKLRQADCRYKGVAQTIEGLDRLTCPKGQPEGVWRSKSDLASLKRKLAALSPDEKVAQFEELKRPCRRPAL
jgi:hypothetical protein